MVASDECYADVYFGEPPLSMLQVQVENVLAIHSCSKRSGMTGYRSGFVAGDPDLVAVLRSLRSHPGVASPDFVAAAATAAWCDDAHAGGAARDLPEEARPLPRLLRRARARVRTAPRPRSTSGWRCRPDDTAASYALRLLDEGIVVAPGTAFGAGEGYVRVALVPTLEECEEAIEAWRRVRT